MLLVMHSASYCIWLSCVLHCRHYYYRRYYYYYYYYYYGLVEFTFACFQSGLNCVNRSAYCCLM